MVFGFGKKKTEQPAVHETKEKTISLEEIPKILQELEAPHMTQAINQAKTTREQIKSNMKNILEIIAHLEKDDLKLDDVDRNLRVTAQRGKDAVVSLVKKETSAPLSNVTKYDDVIVLLTEINQILKRMGDVLGLHSRVIHVFARKYADNLKDEIAKMSNNRNLLHGSITTFESLKTKCKEIEDLGKKISSLRSESMQKKQRVLEIDAKTSTTRDNISRIEKEIHELKSKREYEEFLEIKAKMDALTSEKNEIKNKIDMQFSKISRPLGKYSYIAAFEKPTKKIMGELISDPYQTIISQNKNTIIEILQAVTKAVLSGSVSVKDTQKSIEQIEETISRLDEFLALKETHSKKISELGKELEVFDIKLLESKEAELQKAKITLVDLESTKKKLEHEIEENTSQLSKVISQTESSVSGLTKSKTTLKL